MTNEQRKKERKRQVTSQALEKRGRLLGLTHLLCALLLLPLVSCKKETAKTPIQKGQEVQALPAEEKKEQERQEEQKARSAFDADLKLFFVKAEILGDRIQRGLNFEEFSLSLRELELSYRLLKADWPLDWSPKSLSLLGGGMDYWRFSEDFWKIKIKYEHNRKGAYLQTDFLEESDAMGLYLNPEPHLLVISTLDQNLELDLRYIPWSELPKSLALGNLLVVQAREFLE
ncbi:hypothetical protein AAFN60_20390 [Roseibacillus persicicus]|uniref:hypothetical protein n=1 Tax=Roseibacillus persicicus TaxID=454148 RepID=UPI00398B79E1